MKASASLLSEEGVSREVAESSLSKCLSVICGEYTRKGGCDNASIEGIFSLMIIRWFNALYEFKAE